MQYGLIGEKLGHSFSKEIHTALSGQEYRLCEIPRKNLAEFMKKRDFLGINVTIPYKCDIIPMLDVISESAEKIGAVNTVVNRDGKLYGYNTDYSGLRELISYFRIPIRESKVLILGTGGTSDTAQAVCESLGARRITKASRNPSENQVSYGEAPDKLADTEILINTTPCGMFPACEGMPMDPGSFHHLKGVIDVIYNPLKTRFISKAKKLEVPSAGGLYMLCAQAVYSSELFLSKKYPSETVRGLYKKLLSDKLNIVLTGMPGSGKTTVGCLLAQLLSRKFIDTDGEFSRIYGKTPCEFIKKYGEAEFRAREAEVIKSVSDENSAVIATGGGVVISADNIEKLRRNGRIYFIDRPLEDIAPTDDRPLSSNDGALKRLFAERYLIYRGTCDHIIPGGGTPRDTADRIMAII